MLSKTEAKYLREIAIPNLKAMKKGTKECIEKLEHLRREKITATKQ